jgi:hypothetical protein
VDLLEEIRINLNRLKGASADTFEDPLSGKKVKLWD